MLLANAVALVHAAAVLFMLVGALLALRWPRLVLLHAPVALVILGVNLAGADCPLTDLELWLRERAGAPGYEGGFLGRYLFDPLGLEVDAAGTQLGIYATAIGLNAVGYGLLAARALGSGGAPRARGPLQDPESASPAPAASWSGPTRTSAPAPGRSRP
ncbi:DUF2784 domain-containing protein [Blastococcus sp. MG754426]|uniref:DUF2784 domain-containing protein n=1 Tax=unclassified Blastococcus TaxID=2619396 RepID=UPI001EF06524|nr:MULTISPECIES: DUF2784 domain-containing protein [unclassified Blastococcus]MCF6506974.1 DUF2784 domain-containing protein [Blastococcus sp. MG754426]MCF6510997.1 DUF2784 domain-containing protein [Blastococcus sp. MG754427]